jgi:hypothetical protein
MWNEININDIKISLEDKLNGYFIRETYTLKKPEDKILQPQKDHIKHNY